MLLSLLNICTKEELEEADEGLTDAKETTAESAERKRIIKNKILAVGRVSRVFALLRCVFPFLQDLRPVAPANNECIERSLSVSLNSRASVA
jgi:serine/threonine-protein phosphatase 2B catalytic subunit